MAAHRQADAYARRRVTRPPSERPPGVGSGRSHAVAKPTFRAHTSHGGWAIGSPIHRDVMFKSSTVPRYEERLYFRAVGVFPRDGSK